MGLFGTNPQKMKQIELQNIIFGTEEKKLMVSPEFLDNMSKAYVTKRMKAVNNMAETLVRTKSPSRFFKCYDSVMSNLDELINIEKLYNFKKPVPSEFKKTIEENKDHYIECMIKRLWKAVNQKSTAKAGEKKDLQLFGPVLTEILEYRDKYNDVMLDLIDQFYESVYEHSFRINLDTDTDVNDQSANVPDIDEEDFGGPEAFEDPEDLEVPHFDDNSDDEFVPEEFMRIEDDE
ncbi:MAG: hypothetical protein J1F11_00360 [Oscillospiraceae bacterium]|nr:hypothetical protein [Oscillospiraceae bacterium]